MVLDKIQKKNDIKNLTPAEIDVLRQEIRTFLIEKISELGGHLASNLGTVELTMALHLFLDFPKDKIVWDVGHQSYTHKILTGRKDDFDHLRQYGGEWLPKAGQRVRAIPLIPDTVLLPSPQDLDWHGRESYRMRTTRWFL